MSNPINDPEGWHVATIAGEDTPGVCKVEGADRLRNYDKKTGPGRSGVTQTFRGKGVVELTLTIQLWTADQMDAWDDFASFLKPFADTGKAVDFWHGAVETLDVKAMVITSLGNPKQVRDGDSLFVATIKLSEFTPPPKANVTNTPNGGTGGDGTGQPKPTVLTQNEKEAAQLLDEASKIS